MTQLYGQPPTLSMRQARGGDAPNVMRTSDRIVVPRGPTRHEWRTREHIAAVEKLKARHALIAQRGKLPHTLTVKTPKRTVDRGVRAQERAKQVNIQIARANDAQDVHDIIQRSADRMRAIDAKIGA